MGMTAIGVGSLLTGVMGANAAESAAATQAAAGQAAIGSQERALAEQRALMQPFVGAGETALQRLVAGVAPGGEFAQPYQLGGALPAMGTFKAGETEAQTFARDQALKAMQEQMQRGGQALSTNAIVGAGDLAAKIGSQYEQQAFNQWLAQQEMDYNRALGGRQLSLTEQQAQRQAQLSPLQYLAGLGQAGAAGQAANVGQSAANIAGLQTGIGNVQAAGTIGQAGALGGAVGNVGQMMYLKDLLMPTQPATQQQAAYIPQAGTGQYSLAQSPTSSSFGLRIPG